MSRYALVGEAHEFIDAIKQGAGSREARAGSNEPMQRDSIQVKLPTISLPTFSGDYGEWTTFHDSFDALIHQNAALTSIQRFHYLRSSVSDEAERLISTLPLTAKNYLIAWELLKQRFENKKLIVHHHVSKLMNLPPVSKGSAASLRQLIDVVRSNLKSLQALQLETQHWDVLLVYLITSKLDYTTKRDWEKSCASNELPTLNDLLEFLSHSCQTLEAMSGDPKGTSNSRSDRSNFGSRGQHNKLVHVASGSGEGSCYFCGEQGHLVFSCANMLKMPVQQRIDEVSKRKLCLNCLAPNHQAKSCRSGACRTCKAKHNTLLHKHKSEPEVEEAIAVPTMVAATSTRAFSSRVLLSTALVQAKDKFQNRVLLRALLDSGSESNLITQAACELLQLEAVETNIALCGVNQQVATIRKAVEITIQSRYGPYAQTLSCLVLPNITQAIPIAAIPPKYLDVPTGIELADPSFFRPGDIDILIGNELYLALLSQGRILFGPKQRLIAQNTKLGYIIAGRVEGKYRNPLIKQSYHTTSESTAQINFSLRKFWEIEEVDSKPLVSPEQGRCETHFHTTYKRGADGRFEVELPFRTERPQLGRSYDQALRRLHSLERKFLTNPKLRVEYSTFLKEYEQLGHMEQVPEAHIKQQVGNAYYLPHHAVIKSDRMTTQLRVVFDGSARTSNGLSLNENLLVGPILQPELFATVIRFRMHRFVLTGDIKMMYRQIWLSPKHRRFQRICWREEPQDEVKVFELKTVTYGTASAPYLAVKCLTQLAQKHAQSHPLAARALLTSFYMDDMLTGADSIADVVTTRIQLEEVLGRAGMQLRKFAANNVALLPPAKGDPLLNRPRSINIDKQQDKTLGLYWNHSEDTLSYHIDPDTGKSSVPTKRSMLAKISRIFDPIGLLGPITIKAKMILQRLWLLKLEWDETVPEPLTTEWSELMSELPMINCMKFNRFIFSTAQAQRIELHEFSDASQGAYGAVLYAKTTDCAGCTSVRLVCSKSRVAPIKTQSLPRLELCGALLLAKLQHKIARILGISECIHWTDSTIVLAWLASEPAHLQTFVGNRVAEIQTLTNSNNWYHIDGTDNPADLVSRGLSPAAFLSSRMWPGGPSWLNDTTKQDWAERHISRFASANNVERLEMRTYQQTYCTTKRPTLDEVMQRYSSIKKLTRVVAYCVRFANNCRRRTGQRQDGILNSAEIENALQRILHATQDKDFSQERQRLQVGKPIQVHSKIASLNPFLDSNNLIRVGGRLGNANQLSYNHKHPILLPARAHVT